VTTRDNYTCQLCGKRGGDLELDHEPSLYYHWYYEGGWKMTDEERNKWYQDPNNLQCAHTRCNQSAGTKV
jgi:5-methylcytosine-specific restriction endonuclease McrA